MVGEDTDRKALVQGMECRQSVNETIEDPEWSEGALDIVAHTSRPLRTQKRGGSSSSGTRNSTGRRTATGLGTASRLKRSMLEEDVENEQQAEEPREANKEAESRVHNPWKKFRKTEQ